MWNIKFVFNYFLAQRCFNNVLSILSDIGIFNYKYTKLKKKPFIILVV